MARLTKLNKKTHKFVDSEQWLKYRQLVARKHGGFDDSYVDKKFMRSLGDQVFFCKFCSQEMYAAEYDYKTGAITMSCRTSNCPGNINYVGNLNVRHLDMDIRRMTNQYKYSSRMQW